MLKFISLFPKRWVRLLIHGQGLLRNPFTLGVRVIIEDSDGQVLLVKHSYMNGWYLPGGGVDGGETFHEAACREVIEETGICPDEPIRLLAVYLNNAGLGRDHVALFHLSRWTVGDTYLKANKEILEARFFSADDLPEDVSAATRNRLKEFFSGNLPSGGRWITGSQKND